MATAIMAWVIAIPLLGAVTGLRTMTPIAILSWFAWKGYLDVDGTWAFWTGMRITPIVFTVLALGELIGDKLPSTPNRTATLPLIARTIYGGLVGALAATSLGGSVTEGIFLGAASAVAGTFVGFQVRQALVEEAGLPDLGVAIVEDLLAIGFTIFAVGIVTG